MSWATPCPASTHDPTKCQEPCWSRPTSLLPEPLAWLGHRQAGRQLRGDRTHLRPLFQSEIAHDELCAACQRGADLQPCGTCPRAYHLGCLDPPLTTVPEGVWLCPKCQHKVRGRCRQGGEACPQHRVSGCANLCLPGGP